VRDAAAIDNEDNWTGGFYELAIEVGPTSDARLEETLTALWRLAGIQGTLAVTSRKPLRHGPAPLNLTSLDSAGHLRGVIDLPVGHRSVCGVVAVREEMAGPAIGHSDWLALYVPLGALARIDARIAGFPFDIESGSASLSWRRSLDEWLAGIGRSVYGEVPFCLALVGFEALGDVHADDLGSGVPHVRQHGFLLPQNSRLWYYPATQ